MGLTIAVPKGRLFEQTLDLFEKAGLITEKIDTNTRRLIISGNDYNFLMVRAKDVPVYVNQAVADIGIAGDDVLLEIDFDLYKPVDLGIGYCNIVVAGKPESRDLYFSNPSTLKIATKYPKIAHKFFSEKGIKIQIFELYGSVELAPLVEMADFIVDIVETGRTLKENGLVVIDTIRPSTAKLIVNRVSYKTKRKEILNLIENLENYLEALYDRFST